MRRSLSIAALFGASLSASSASALVTPEHRGSEASGALVAPAGLPPLRHEARTRYGAAPPALRDAWAAFVADTTSPRWQALWDADTHRPLRVFGGFVEAPGASEHAAVAEKHARAFLERHAALLLAGRSMADFELTVNHEAGGLRTVGFQQITTAAGVKIPVLGGRVNVRYKADRLFLLGAEALGVTPFGAPRKTATEARASALAHLSSISNAWGSGSPSASSAPNPSQPLAVATSVELVALPLVRRGDVRAVLAWRVTTESASPESRTDVFVDAADASILATQENIRFLAGTLKYEAPVRGPQGHMLYPAALAHLSADGALAGTDAEGAFSLDPPPSSLSCSAAGDLVQVVNMDGDDASLSFAPVDGAEVVWSMKDDELGDAQLSAFVHTSIAKDHARAIDPGMTFLDKSITVKVNGVGTEYACNAYWDGYTMNFFQEYQVCNNTARMADVVYHEFGHAFHWHSVLPGVGAYDPALGEGGADYFASVVTGDPYLAPGFFTNGAYLREFDSDRR